MIAFEIILHNGAVCQILTGCAVFFVFLKALQEAEYKNEKRLIPDGVRGLVAYKFVQVTWYNICSKRLYGKSDGE